MVTANSDLINQLHMIDTAVARGLVAAHVSNGAKRDIREQACILWNGLTNRPQDETTVAAAYEWIATIKQVFASEDV